MLPSITQKVETDKRQAVYKPAERRVLSWDRNDITDQEGWREFQNLGQATEEANSAGKCIAHLSTDGMLQVGQ